MADKAAAAAPPPDVPHAVSMKKHGLGTEHEHWALHFHPVTPGQGDLHVLHAVSQMEKDGVLRVEHDSKGPYRGESSNSIVHHIANFPSKAAGRGHGSSARRPQQCVLDKTVPPRKLH
jgi:hypothetical protein